MPGEIIQEITFDFTPLLIDRFPRPMIQVLFGQN